MKASEYQMDIFNYVKDSNKSLMIEAVAGSGKTTTIIALTKILKNEDSTLFCAFNKSITLELRSRLPRHIECMTLNAIGYRALGAGEVNSNKIYDILMSSNVQSRFNIKWNEGMGSIIPKLVGLAKLNEFLPDTTSISDWMDLIDHFDVTIPLNAKLFDDIVMYKHGMDKKRKRCIDISRYVLDLSNKFQNIIDFNDQLYLPIINNIPFKKYKTVLVDEYQDISRIQSKIIQRSLADNGRFIGVGDREQSIYAFRGANDTSIESGISMFNAESLPLNYSYRCPINVVMDASKYSNKISAHPEAKQGTVESSLGNYRPDMFAVNDLILCRNTAPLIKLAFVLIKSNKAIHIRGNTIGKSIIQRIKSLNCKMVPQLVLNLVKWKEIEIKRRKDIDIYADLSLIESQYDSIMAFIENMDGTGMVSELIKDINRLFSDSNKNSIILSTIHKAKGTESKRVFILDRQLIPSKYAKKKHHKKQEMNLIYVAITRSGDYLGYITTPENESKK